MQTNKTKKIKLVKLKVKDDKIIECDERLLQFSEYLRYFDPNDVIDCTLHDENV